MQKASMTLLMAVVCIFTTFSQIQNQAAVFTIKGTVVDSVSSETVPFVSVSVLNIKMPAKPLKRVAADADGKFELTVNSTDNIVLKFDAVGMKSTAIPLKDFSGKTIDLGNVKLSSNDKMLSEVTVTATKPLVKVDLDKIVYDIKSDPESQTNNVLEMLKKVPLVTVDGEESIKLKGKSNFKIYMNGKPTNVFANNPSQVLKTMPANAVKNIEVITEPGAKYEAEGVDGIINIVTDKTVAGYNGSVNAGIDMYGALNGGIYFSVKRGKWGMTSNLNTGQFRSPESVMDYYRLNKTNNSELNQNSTTENNGNYRRGNISMSYEIDSLNLITITGSGWGGNSGSFGDTYSKLTDENSAILQSYNQTRNSKFSWGGYESEIDYQRSFRKPDKLFTLMYKYSVSPRNTDNETEMSDVVNYPANRQHIWSKSSGKEHTFQVDYTEPFNKKHIVEIGAKYIIRDNSSRNNYEQFAPGSGVPEAIPGLINDDFSQRQDILGSYASYTLRQMKYSLKIGARYEHTSSGITYKRQTHLNFEPDPFDNFVPSFNFNYKLTDMSNIQFSYTQRLSRPSISYLNPFKDTSSPNNVRIGNPDLKTEISNSFSLNYGFFKPKFNFNASLFHSFVNNSISQFSYLSGDTTYTTFNNIGVSRNTGVSTYFRWQVTPKINTYFNGNTSYSYLADGKGNKNQGFNYGGNIGSAVTFPANFTLNLYTGLFKMDLRLQGGGNTFFFYGLGLNKSILNKKLTFSLNANTFLQKYMKFGFYTDTETFRDQNNFKRLAPNLRFNVSYTFGEMKEQINKAKRSIKNDDLKSGGDNTGGEPGTGTGTGTTNGNGRN